MNISWSQFISNQSSSLDATSQRYLESFNQGTLSSDNPGVMAALSHQAIIEVAGDDALNFLQGQLSNDIKLVNPELSQISSWSTPKGRVLAIFRIVMQNDKYYLITETDLKEALIKRLNMFVLMSKVTITDRSEEMVLIGLSGTNNLAEKHLPTKANTAGPFEQGVAFNIDTRCLLLTGAESAISLWQELSQSFDPVNSEFWHLLDILNAKPVVNALTSEKFVAQMLNLDVLEGINFKKGCYTGQEVIARLHYLGKQKRKMYLAKVTTKTEPVAGAEIFSKDEHSGQGSGTLVDVAKTSENNYLILLVLQIANLEKDTFLNTDFEDKIELLPMPYSLEI